eukprot:2786220-Amphidinium_carterae.1
MPSRPAESDRSFAAEAKSLAQRSGRSNCLEGMQAKAASTVAASKTCLSGQNTSCHCWWETTPNVVAPCLSQV